MLQQLMAQLKMNPCEMNPTSCSNDSLWGVGLQGSGGGGGGGRIGVGNVTGNGSALNGTAGDGVLYDYLYDYGEEYDIGYRVRTFLAQPHNIISVILGTCGIAANLLSILAISKLCYGTLSSHFRLLISLALSDMVISLSVLLHILNTVVNAPGYPGLGPERERLLSRCFYMLIKALNSTGLNVTLLNLMAMAIDHYVAILRPLHYPVLLSKKRSTIMVTSLWIVAAMCGFSDFFSAYPKYYKHMETYNFCEFIWLTKYQEEYTIFAIALIALFVMTTLYLRIYQEVRQHRLRIAQHQEYVKNRKALVTTLLILGTFVLCWLPMSMFQIALLIQVRVDPASVERLEAVLLHADRYIYNLMLLNTIADPIIYAVRVKEVQFGYRRLCWCCCRGADHLRRRRSARSYEFSLTSDLTRKASQRSSATFYVNGGGGGGGGGNGGAANHTESQGILKKSTSRNEVVLRDYIEGATWTAHMLRDHTVTITDH